MKISEILIYIIVGACVLSCHSHVQLLATQWTIALQAPLTMGFSKQEYWNGLPCPPPGDLPDPGIEPTSSVLQENSLLLSHQGSPDSPTKESSKLQNFKEVNVCSMFNHIS